MICSLLATTTTIQTNIPFPTSYVGHDAERYARLVARVSEYYEAKKSGKQVLVADYLKNAQEDPPSELKDFAGRAQRAAAPPADGGAPAGGAAGAAPGEQEEREVIDLPDSDVEFML